MPRVRLAFGEHQATLLQQFHVPGYSCAVTAEYHQREQTGQTTISSTIDACCCGPYRLRLWVFA